MSRFRASDDELDREIRTLGGLARLRRRRAQEELDALERDLAELVRERQRRRGERVASAGAGAEPLPA
jgi:hypothetical protein